MCLRHYLKTYTAVMSRSLFYSLFLIYWTMIIGFTLIYFVLGRGFVFHNNVHYASLSLLEQLYECFYFSGVTMLTIGYGDLAPVGLGRILALVQALIGFILPTAFVMQFVHMQKNKDH